MHARVILAGVFALATPLATSVAQGTTATLTGHVTDTAGTALAGAVITVSRVGPRGRSDPSGAFRITGIRPGTRIVVVQHPRYHSATLKLSLRRGETRDTTVRLQVLPVPLDTVKTEARATSENLQRNGFYTRQRLGFGYFLDRDAIARMPGYDIADILRHVPFVQVLGTPGLPVLLLSPSNCRPAVYVDGLPNPYIGDIPVEIVDGVEVYRHATDVPVEYTHGRSPCGAVLIWTR